MTVENCLVITITITTNISATLGLRISYDHEDLSFIGSKRLKTLDFRIISWLLWRKDGTNKVFDEDSDYDHKELAIKQLLINFNSKIVSTSTL